jgi:hypothetical protein
MQFEKLDWPKTGWNIPMGHAVGVTEDAGQYEPAGHMMYDTRPTAGQ